MRFALLPLQFAVNCVRPLVRICNRRADADTSLSQGRGVALTITFTAFVFYSGVFFLLFPAVGDNVRVAAVIPGIAAALCFGLRGAIVLSLGVTLLCSPLYLYLLSGESLATIYRGNIVPTIANSVVPMITGHMRDMYITMRMLNREINRIHSLDELTGTLNRRALYDLGNREFKRVMRQRRDASFYLPGAFAPQQFSLAEKRYKEKGNLYDYIAVFSCAILDIDHFKKINDQHGHLAGDQALRAIGELLSESGILRESDLVGRYGGEEFVIIFPGTSVKNALLPLTMIRKCISELVITLDNSRQLCGITVSCGIDQLQDTDSSIDDVLRRADAALYQAKQRGRDCIECAENKSAQHQET